MAAKDDQIMNKLFKSLPPIPKKFVKQICQRELISTAYLFTFRSDGERKGYCTECKKIVSLEKKRTETIEDLKNRNHRHNERGYCPECKSKVTFKDSGRGKNKLWDYSKVIIMQKAGNMLVARYFDVTRSYRHFSLEHIDDNCGVGELQFHEEHRIFLDAKNRKVYQFDQNWYFYGNDNTAKYYGYEVGDAKISREWHKRKSSFRTVYSEYETSIIYGLTDKLLKNTGFEYCPITIYESNTLYRDYVAFLIKYAMYPQAVEYMMKCGFPELFTKLLSHKRVSLLNMRAKTPEGLLKLSKQDITMLRQGKYGNKSSSEILEYLQKLSKHNLSYEEKEYFIRNVSQYRYDRSWSKILKYTTYRKAENYIKKHAKGTLLPLEEYGDYIVACETLGWNLCEHRILFPRDLLEAHDRANAILKAEEGRLRAEAREKSRKKRILEGKSIDEKIQERFSYLSEMWEFHSNGYFIRPAKNLEEIIFEGDYQNICVGSPTYGYTKRHADGTAYIFFVRKESEADTPLYTVEITASGTVVQCRGHNNRPPTSYVSEFMNKFRSYIENKSLKMTA